MIRITKRLALAFFALFVISRAEATPVTGLVNFAGNVSVSATAIMFSPNFDDTQGAMATESFAGFTDGAILSLTNGPATGAVNVPGFMHFTTGLASPVTFDLTYIAPGVGSVNGCFSGAVGSSCTPAGSPFTLFQLSSNTILASLQFNGVSYTGTPDSGTSPTVAAFSTQVVSYGSIPAIYQALANGDTIAGITYSGTLVATNSVPEPAQLGLAAGMLLGAAGLLSRRSKQ